MRRTSYPDNGLPTSIKPMLARLTRYPFDSSNHIFELKWDGMRALAFIEAGSVRVQSRDLTDITPRFPEMERLARLVKSDMTVLDGELVCFGPDGKPSFTRMQERLRRPAGGRAYKGPRAHFVAFDVLYADGRSVMGESLGRRKNILHELLEPGDVVQACQFIENEGKAFFAVTQQHELEGIVAKDKAGHYTPGRRSPGWHKIKRLRECDFVIGGYDLGGERGEMFGSLIVGMYDGSQRLVSVGHVGSGLSRAVARQLQPVLQSLHTARCPFQTPPRVDRLLYWCRPELVCRVEYGEFTNHGRLRYATYVSQVGDKSPADCKIDDAPGWPAELPIG